jgi:hypothetical protein
MHAKRFIRKNRYIRYDGWYLDIVLFRIPKSGSETSIYTNKYNFNVFMVP